LGVAFTPWPPPVEPAMVCGEHLYLAAPATRRPAAEASKAILASSSSDTSDEEEARAKKRQRLESDAAPSSAASSRAEGGDLLQSNHATEASSQIRPVAGALEPKRRSKFPMQRKLLGGPALPRFVGPLRAVLFDFDATLSAIEGMSVERLFPQRGGCVDVAWLRECGFGGEERILRLGATLQALAASGVELHIVSLADRAMVVRALAILGALHFFCDRISGWEEIGGLYASKAPFIKSLMEDKKWCRDEVLFIDDQERNVEDVRGLCLTHLTWGQGLCAEELIELERRACEMQSEHLSAA